MMALSVETMVRFANRFFQLPPEAQAAVQRTVDEVRLLAPALAGLQFDLDALALALDFFDDICAAADEEGAKQLAEDAEEMATLVCDQILDDVSADDDSERRS